MDYEIILLSLGVIILSFIIYANILIFLGLKNKFAEPPSLSQLPTVTILIAAKGESKILSYTLTYLNDLKYPRDKLHIIVAINEDDEETIKACLPFTNYVDLIKVERECNKPSALNQAFKHIDSDLILLLDADSIIEKDALYKMIPLIEQNAVAVTGIPSPINEQEGILPKFFAIECNFWRDLTLAKDSLKLFVQAPGSSSLICSSSIRDVGGWDEEALAEDNDLSLRLLILGKRIRIAPVKVSLEAPARLREFIKQRFRWYRGTIDVYRKRFKEIWKLKFLKRLDVSFTFLSPFGLALILPFTINSLLFGSVSKILLLCFIFIQLMVVIIEMRGSSKFILKIALLMFPYTLLQSLICLVAILSIALPIKPKWIRTKKSGLYLKPKHVFE